MVTASWPVKMIADLGSLDSMRYVGGSMGVTIEVLAKAGHRYGASIVPAGYSYVCISAGNKMTQFWDLVSKEKTKRRLQWLAAHPVQ